MDTGDLTNGLVAAIMTSHHGGEKKAMIVLRKLVIKVN